jgi:hypothetical protein
MEQHFGQVVYIKTMLHEKIIPAILRCDDSVLPGRYSIWIPDGYDGAGGYSSRVKNEVYIFDGSDDIKKDVMTQWLAEQERIQ